MKKHDIVVIVPEYDQFYGDYANGDNTLNTALLYAPPDRIPDFIRSYSVVDVVWKPRVENARRSFLHAAAAAVGRENQFFPRDTNPVYNRHSFNAYGDVVSHQNRKGHDPDSIYVAPLPPMKDFNRHTLDDLNSVQDRAIEVGARAYFMYPSYIDRSYVINVAAIDSLARKLRENLEMPIIGTPRDFVFPKTYFFDTRYHLNWDARPIRTREMIDLLRVVAARDGWMPASIAPK
jgi:plasmid stabilization system protein ParE